MQAEETPKTCAACGEPIVQSVGARGEYCSRECFKAGRAFCKFCNKSLSQPSRQGFKRDFCDTNCSNRYRQVGGPISSSLLDEWNRSTCKACGKPITQSRTNKKQFCSMSCRNRYHRAWVNEQDPLQEWGSYGPETRRALRNVAFNLGLGAAKQVAAAIDREYVPRKRGSLTRRSRTPTMITCHCKTCGKEFKRTSWSHRDREYCKPAIGQKCRLSQRPSKIPHRV